MQSFAPLTWWCPRCGATKRGAQLDVPLWSRPIAVDGVNANPRDWLLHIAGLHDTQLLAAIAHSINPGEVDEASMRIMVQSTLHDQVDGVGLPGSEEDRAKRRAQLDDVFAKLGVD